MGQLLVTVAGGKASDECPPVASEQQLPQQPQLQQPPQLQAVETGPPHHEREHVHILDAPPLFIPLLQYSSAGPLIEAIRDALPPEFASKWRLLYCSAMHGKSFTQLVRRCVNRGPTLIMVREAAADDGETGQVFGGFADDDWITSAEQARRAKIQHAALLRDQCSGVHSHAACLRSPQFMGCSGCFVFTTRNGGRVYRSRSNGNQNYMYLSDAGSASRGRGIGMGSTKDTTVGEFAWFLDSTLSRGQSSASVVPTFCSTRLSNRGDFVVSCVQVFALDESRWEGTVDAEDRCGDEQPSKITERFGVECAILQLNGRRFYSEQEGNGDDCCSSSH